MSRKDVMAGMLCTHKRYVNAQSRNQSTMNQDKVMTQRMLRKQTEFAMISVPEFCFVCFYLF